MNLAAALKPCRHLALLAGLAGGLAAASAQAAFSDPAQIQTEAYVNLVQADQSLDAGRLDEALSLYKTARDYYQQLAQDFPGWEPRVVQYRTTYCGNQIADVERRKSGGQPLEFVEPPVEEPLPETAAPAAAAVAKMPPPETEPEPEPAAADRSVEIDYLKTRIANLETLLADFTALQTERDALAGANARLQQDLEAANRKLAENAGQDTDEREKLRAELAAKDQQIQSLQAEVETGRQREQAVNRLEAHVAELNAQHERLAKELQTRDDELDDTERRLEQAETKSQQDMARAARDLDQLRGEKAELEMHLAAQANRPAHGEPIDRRPEIASAKPGENAAAMVPAAAPTLAASASATPPERPADSSKSAATASPVPEGMSAALHVRQLLAKGDNDAALATVQAAREHEPDDVNLALIEGIALVRLQQYSEAATLLNKLAKNNPHNAEIHAAFGAAMMGAGFYEEAREILQMALRLDKNMPECLYNLAQLHAFIDPIDGKLARKYYRQARELGLVADPQLEKVLR